MSEEAKTFGLVMAGIVLIAALFLVLFIWGDAAIRRDIHRAVVANAAARCVGNDIWNEQRIAECHATAERDERRRDELWRRRYEPAKPTTGE